MLRSAVSRQAGSAGSSPVPRETQAQLQPQECGVHPQPPDIAALSEDALAPFADFPAVKTDSCNVWLLLAHFGQAISCRADITMRS